MAARPKFVEAGTISPHEAFRILNVSRSTGYRAIARNEIPHVRIGGLLRVPLLGLEEMLKNASSGKKKINQITAQPTLKGFDFT